MGNFTDLTELSLYLAIDSIDCHFDQVKTELVDPSYGQ